MEAKKGFNEAWKLHKEQTAKTLMQRSHGDNKLLPLRTSAGLNGLLHANYAGDITLLVHIDKGPR